MAVTPSGLRMMMAVTRPASALGAWKCSMVTSIVAAKNSARMETAASERSRRVPW